MARADVDERITTQEKLRALLEGDVRLVTVFGLRGLGSSTVARAALARRRSMRLDATGWDPRRAQRELGRLAPREDEWVFLDQAHAPHLLRSASQRLLSRGARVVVAGTGPLDLAGEQHVPLAPWPVAATSAFLESEARRLGVRASAPSAALLEAIDGWPLAARAALVALRAGADPALTPLHPFSSALDEALRVAWARLGRSARALADVLALAHGPREAGGLAGDGAALAALQEAGLIVRCDDDVPLLRMLAPARAWIRAALDGSPRRRATAQSGHVARTLAIAASARDAHRADPSGTRRRLARIEADLFELALVGRAPESSAAALGLEPLLHGVLGRAEVARVFSRAHEAAPDDVEVALALARILIARGEHESAQALLARIAPRKAPVFAAALRHVWLGHLAVWRGELELAETELDAAARVLARPPREPARHRRRRDEVQEDLLLQRAFLALRRSELDAAESLARTLAERAARGPSVRMASLARRLIGEVALARGDAARAVALLSQSRDELWAQGDALGALFLSSRVALALTAAGATDDATRAATLAAETAARAGEPAHEALLLLCARDRPPPPQVLDLVWRVQVPEVRAALASWLEQHPAEPPATLVIEPHTRRAVLGARAADLSERRTPWRVLLALAEAHRAGRPLDADDVFRAGWPEQRASSASRKKRVHTAIWALRRDLLGTALVTIDGRYGLDRALRVVGA